MRTKTDIKNQKSLSINNQRKYSLISKRLNYEEMNIINSPGSNKRNQNNFNERMFKTVNVKNEKIRENINTNKIQFKTNYNFNSPMNMKSIYSPKKMEVKFPKHDQKFNLFFNNAKRLTSNNFGNISIHNTNNYEHFENNENFNNDEMNININNFDDTYLNEIKTPSPKKKIINFLSPEEFQSHRLTLIDKKKAYSVRKTNHKRKFILQSDNKLENFRLDETIEELNEKQELIKEFTEVVFSDRVEFAKTQLNINKINSSEIKNILPNIHGRISLRQFFKDEVNNKNDEEDSDIRMIEKNGEAFYQSSRKKMSNFSREKSIKKVGLTQNVNGFSLSPILIKSKFSNAMIVTKNNYTEKFEKMNQTVKKNPFLVNSCYVDNKPFFHRKSLSNNGEFNSKMIKTKDKLTKISDKIQGNLNNILMIIDGEKL